MPNHMPPEALSLQAFINLPNTVSFHVVYRAQVQEYLNSHPEVRLGTVLVGGYAILYTAREHLRRVSEDLRQDFISILPQIYTTLGREDLHAAGISQVFQTPTLDLRGRNIAIGFVDTGIDYTNRCFQHADGTSRILSIWDQTLEGAPPPESPFGAAFSQEQINAALQSPDPFAIVPQRDTDGHGTFLASVACGSDMGEYIGAAPDAHIIAVKLKRANQALRDIVQVPPEQENVFSSADIMLGVKYILDEALRLREAEMVSAVVICIGLGTNYGGHDGRSILEEYITGISRGPSIVFCTAAGNESTTRRHTMGTLTQRGDVQAIDIRVERNVRAFNVVIASSIRDRVSVSLKSPTGEIIDRVPFGSSVEYRRRLLLESSTIIIFYSQGNFNAAVVQILSPTPGIWQIRVHGDMVLEGTFHAWLPVTGLVDSGVEFIMPVPAYTLVLPSTSEGAIVSGAYNGRNNTAYVNSSWGPTRDGRMLPDFVAPGVDVSGFFPGNRTGVMTGTSVAAAITAGASAIMMQWGVAEGNMPAMTSQIVRSLLIMGCDRDAQQDYPNRQVGYGRLNLLQSFLRMRER